MQAPCTFLVVRRISERRNRLDFMMEPSFPLIKRSISSIVGYALYVVERYRMLVERSRMLVERNRMLVDYFRESVDFSVNVVDFSVNVVDSPLERLKL